MYRSCCSASSSAWSPGLGTTAWPHSPSFRHRCASPNQSPESEEQATGTGSHLGPRPPNEPLVIKVARREWTTGGVLLTFSSQSSFTARLLGFRSWRGHKYCHVTHTEPRVSVCVYLGLYNVGKCHTTFQIRKQIRIIIQLFYKCVGKTRSCLWCGHVYKQCSH